MKKYWMANQVMYRPKFLLQLSKIVIEMKNSLLATFDKIYLMVFGLIFEQLQKFLNNLNL